MKTNNYVLARNRILSGVFAGSIGYIMGKTDYDTTQEVDPISTEELAENYCFKRFNGYSDMDKLTGSWYGSCSYILVKDKK